MLRLCACLIIFIVLLYKPIEANETSCEASQKLFADLCFSPTPKYTDIDFAELTKDQPKENHTIWFTHLGNDVEQLHVSELLKGELLSPKDDFSDMCYRFTIDHGENATGDGQALGYGNRTAGWSCKPSQDFPGAEICDFRSTLSKYHEDAIQYISYLDETTEFTIYISCWPNGQVGWGTYSKTPKLTEKEVEFAVSYTEKLGFPKNTNVVMYGDNCTK